MKVYSPADCPNPWVSWPAPETRRYLAAHGLDPHDFVRALDGDNEAMAAALRRHDIDGAAYALH